jgi:hypothetical protein
MSQRRYNSIDIVLALPPGYYILPLRGCRDYFLNQPSRP